MTYNSHTLFILVEGDDDERFFQNVVNPSLEKRYQEVKIVKYAADSPKTIRKYIQSFLSSSTDYLLIADINSTPCVRQKKKKIREKISTLIDRGKIIIVKREIESWYAAGMNPIKNRKYKMQRIFPTDTLTKERFDSFIPKHMSRIEFFQEILEDYDKNTGKQKNTSLRYFFNKHSI